MVRRRVLPFAIVVMLVGVAGWTFVREQLPPADLTFCNGTDIKTIDPATVTGMPEGRVVDALFEGLCRRDPQTLKPIPGIAKSWQISSDLKTYTFEIRENARWSNGNPITSADFIYSFQRFLLPETTAEYAYQLWYVKNAKRYTTMKPEVGEAVEVELPRADDVPNTMRGEILAGKLNKLETHDVEVDGEKTTRKIFEVEIGGAVRRFTNDDDLLAADSRLERCAWVMPSFELVGIKADGPYRLILTLENPTPFFLDIIAFYPLGAVNRQCLETHGSPGWTRTENLVSSGPFRMQFRRIRDRIRLVKNEHYWNRDAVKLNTVDVLAVEGGTTMLNMYLTGACDWITDVPAPAAPTLMRERPEQFHPKPILGTYFYRFNVRRKPFDDSRVRRALSLALDRREIVEKVTRTGQVPALSLTPPGLAGYEPPTTSPENIDEAKRLLAEAGFPEGRGFPSFDILYNTQDTHKAIAELIQDRWKHTLGLNVKLRNLEWGTFLDTVRLGEYDVARASWIGDYADPNTFLDMFETGNENNQTGWGNADYDKLIGAAASEPDAAKRFKALGDAEKILMTELPIAPIYFYVSKDMVQPYVKGFYHNLRDEHPLWALSIDEDEKRKVRSAEGFK